MSGRTQVPLGALRGSIEIPGDKSISHRALLLNTLASGPAQVRGLLDSGDVRATASACRALGAEITRDGEGWIVRPPADGLREPEAPIDCENSGTSIRLLLGIVASHPIFAVLTGDASLRGRPMARVVEPLRRMGASVQGRRGGRLAPLAVQGGALRASSHDLPIASAQVKTCLLLAGLRTGVALREPRRSRDHTERMLRAMGAKLVEDSQEWLRLAPTPSLRPIDVDVPGDLSAGAFPIVAALLVPGSEITLDRVGINPTRAGVLDALQAMGADLEITPQPTQGPEPIARITARYGPLRGTRIDGELALRCLDEIPILAVAAAFAEGQTEIADASELRVKESDRIARVATGLTALGVQVDERPDGMIITGGAPLGPATIDASGDHRIAMAFTVAGLACEGGVTVHPQEVVDSSYPAFYHHLQQLGAHR